MKKGGGSDDSDPNAYRNCLEKLIRTNKEIVLLSLLAERPMCGYDLIKEILSRTDVFLGQGLIYPILYNLEDEGILRAEYSEDDKRSKIYFLTHEGEKIADARIDGLAEAAEYLLFLVKRERSIPGYTNINGELAEL
jgi:PadR family transcriptional regulator PadR